MNKTLFFAAVFACSSLPAFGQQDAKEVVIKTTELAPGVAMLEGMGGNLGVSYGEDGVFLIDDQFAPLFPKIQAAIAALSKQPVRIVFNTHWHFDHVGGNLPMAESGALLVAQDNVRKRMSVEQVMKLFDKTIPAAPHKALPVVTFASEVTFHVNGDDVTAVHLPNAHTDGDAALKFAKANVLHTGDCMFNGGYPLIDVTSGGSIDGYIAAQEKMLSLIDEHTKIIPGHGALATRADLVASHQMLKSVRERIAKLVHEGKTMEEAIAAKPTADLDGKWGQGFVKAELIIKTSYASLKK